MARGKRAVEASAEPVEGPWELPDGWRWEQLGGLGAWFGGGTPSKANDTYWTGGDIPWVSPKDMKSLFIDDSEDHITQSAVDGSSTKLVPQGSVLIVTRSGILKHSLPVAVNRRDVTLNQDMRALHPRAGVLAGFVANYLRCASQNILHSCVKDGTTVNSVEAERLMAWPVPIPPHDVQRRTLNRINYLFDQIDEGEAALGEARAGVETYRKALLKAAVTGELTADWRRDNPPAETGQDLLRRILAERKALWEADPKNRKKRYVEPTVTLTSDLIELPEGWCWVSLDQLSWSSQYGTSMKCSVEAKGEPVLRIPNLKAGLIDLGDMKYANAALNLPSGEYIAPGDLLIVRTNGSKELIGRTGIALERLNHATFFASYLIRFRLIGDRALWAWIRAFTESAVFRARVGASIASSAGQYNLSMGKLDTFPIAMPPLGELMEILRLLDRNGGPSAPEIDTNSLRQSILSAAFRGELA